MGPMAYIITDKTPFEANTFLGPSTKLRTGLKSTKSNAF